MIDTLQPKTYRTVNSNGDSITINVESEKVYTPELFSKDNIKVSNIAGGFKLIEYTRTNVPSGTHRHSAVIGSTNTYNYQYYQDDSLGLVGTDTINVIVDTITNLISTPTFVTDKNGTTNGNFNLTISLPINHEATIYEIRENNILITSGSINTNRAFSLTLPIVGKTTGTYNYIAKVLNSTMSVTSSTVTVNSTYVPPQIIIASACTTNSLTAPIRTRTNFTYSFTLNPNCPITSYKALFYSGANSGKILATNSSLTTAQLNNLIWKPELGTLTNKGYANGNIKFTSSELASKVFTRVANPLPLLCNRWYKIEIICTTCTQTNKKRVGYFFVQ
jgi:hypothetical protein